MRIIAAEVAITPQNQDEVEIECWDWANPGESRVHQGAVAPLPAPIVRSGALVHHFEMRVGHNGPGRRWFVSLWSLPVDALQLSVDYARPPMPGAVSGRSRTTLSGLLLWVRRERVAERLRHGHEDGSCLATSRGWYAGRP